MTQGGMFRVSGGEGLFEMDLDTDNPALIGHWTNSDDMGNEIGEKQYFLIPYASPLTVF